MGNEKEKDSGKSFIETLNRFDKNIESLRQFYKYLHPVAQRVDKKTLDVFVKKLESITATLEEAKKQGKKIEQKVIKSVLPDLLEMRRDTPTINTQILYKNIVITLCSYLEILISDLAKLFYTNSQNNLLDKNEITFADIKFLQTVEDIKELLIDKKIFELTNASFDDWLTFLKKTVDLKIDPLIEYYYMPVKEVLERRHIFVHNDGIVNKKYKNNVDQSYIAKLSDKIKVGEHIPTNSGYLNNSIRYIENFGELVTHCLWYKLYSKNENSHQKEIRELRINEYLYTKIESEDFLTAEEFGRFVINNFKFTKEYNSICVQVNYWQSLKWQGKLDDEIKKEIETIDLGDKSNKTRMAVYALLDKREDFFRVAKAAVKSQEISRYDLEEWPVFKEMRQDPKFGSLIKRKKMSKSSSSKDVHVVAGVKVY